MATLDQLKAALRKKTSTTQQRRLSDEQHSEGFTIMLQGLGRKVYQDFVTPQLAQLLTRLSYSRPEISVLEIGPGPKSVLGSVPDQLKRKIKKYVAFEPNALFAKELEQSIGLGVTGATGLYHLEGSADIRHAPFVAEAGTESNFGAAMAAEERFDLVLFCHSMYGMHPKRAFIEKALGMLTKEPGGVVAVFHREGCLDLEGLVCQQMAFDPTGVISVPNEDRELDIFAQYVAGYALQNSHPDETSRLEWREECRGLGRTDRAHPNSLLFRSPEIMFTFNQHATKLPELLAEVPTGEETRAIKSPEARLRQAAAIVRPTMIRHIQQCVQWASKYDLRLTVLGGTHSGNCIWTGIVAIDMTAYSDIKIIPAEGSSNCEGNALVVAEAGCKNGDIVRDTIVKGLTVPLGARPSVGVGLWLQGGVGHLARQYGLTSDAIIGAVLVSVDGRVLYVGGVPSQHRPIDAVRPENELDLLWALRGAGTNFGVVVSVVFNAHPTPTFLTRNWIVGLSGSPPALDKLAELALISKNMPRSSSMDMYLYWSHDQLNLGVSLFDSFTATAAAGLSFSTLTATSQSLYTMLGPEKESRIVDGIGLFDTEMYVSAMHGGHGGGKTSSFKRCVFLKDVGAPEVVKLLYAAVETRPSSFCYLHLLHGGGAIADVASGATAFGCRDWEFACVVTGVWDREQDGTQVADAAVQWVYNVVRDLLPLSCGVYGADLGPDPRDANLAALAFGTNSHRLARLKNSLDPQKILACACPLSKVRQVPKLIILVTGEICAGKDFCANVWVNVLLRKNLTARLASISDAHKREYAVRAGADLDELHHNRAYKEKHRPAMTALFQRQKQERPQLPEEHFLNIVHSATDVDVLLITGMRDESPVSNFWHLVAHSRLLEVRVSASEKNRQARGGPEFGKGIAAQDLKDKDKDKDGIRSSLNQSWQPDLIFDNDLAGIQIVEMFAEDQLMPFLHKDLEELAGMVRSYPGFPREGLDFQHVLNIAQEAGGLSLCTNLLRQQFGGDWSQVDAVACCESGGFIFGSALAAELKARLVLMRETRKLPPPTVSVRKYVSHISSQGSQSAKDDMIEMNEGVVSKGSSLVVVDDVLATGSTLLAMLRLLTKAGVRAEDIRVMVVAEFPSHRGRHFLRQHGFGSVGIQSLLVFDSV